MTRTRILTAIAAVLLASAGALLLMHGRAAAFPADFPYTWLPAGATTNDPEAVQVVRSGSPTETFGDQAAVLHPAYACDDPECPARDAEGRPLIFPYGIAGDNRTVFSVCPAGIPGWRKGVAPSPPHGGAIRPYLTAEGERIMRGFSDGR